MANLLKGKMKILFLCLFVLLTCTACSSPRATDGKLKVDQIISSEKVEIRKDLVNVTDIEDKDLKKEYAKYDDDDLITIEPMTFGEAFSSGWFTGLIVWPLAQLINIIASFTDAGWGIILTTILIQGVVFLFTKKSQMSSQRMQEIQPEMQRIQNKYAGKTDDHSRLMMAQETQKLYQKYDIHPFGTLLVTLIQLPIMMGVYYAMTRASSVVLGSFMGISLSQTPLYGFQHLEIAYIVIYVLMIICSLVSLKMPQILKKRQDKIDHVKKKEYLDTNNSAMNSMNTTMYFSTGLIAILYISWPIAMAFYWLVSSLTRMCFSVFLHAMIVKQKKAS
ncbi:membrane protein insertase YidC [uncultured Faecalicoccus sp.]|uniref:membrane protein insertase YidC n=1 Tax=uncultured Faecalicoccus sp. TaxID=1971760 RepID=UPI0025FA9B11|nr:membrane protein insertase YidC [uncultured Faecalicoccus sp.]